MLAHSELGISLPVNTVSGTRPTQPGAISESALGQAAEASVGAEVGGVTVDIDEVKGGEREGNDDDNTEVMKSSLV